MSSTFKKINASFFLIDLFNFNEIDMFNINELTLSKLNDDYGFVEFNDIKLYVTNDKKMFNASKLIKSFKEGKHSFEVWLKGKGKEFHKLFINDFVYVCGKGTQEFKGWYVSCDLIREIVSAIELTKGCAWLRGKAWQDLDESGYLYLIQCKSDIGTNVYKVGETKELSSRMNNYEKGSYVLGLYRVTKRHEAERKLKSWFKDNHCPINRGSEYFETKDLDEAYELFDNAPLKNLTIGDVELFEPGDLILTKNKL